MIKTKFFIKNSIMRIIFTFTPIILAASWAIYNIFFLIKKSIPVS